MRESTKTSNWERARRYADRREKQIEDGFLPIPVAEAVDAFLVAKTVAESTRRRYGRALRPLATFSSIERIETLDGITLPLLDRFKQWREVDPSTWVKELETLRSFFRYATKRGWCRENPAAEIETPKGVRLSRPRQPYSAAEIVRIIAACLSFGRHPYERLRAHAMIMLMYRYGLRVSDVATLRRDRIQGNQLFLYAHKNGEPVWAPLYPDVREALDRVPVPKGARPDCEYFFWTGKGDKDGHISTVDRTLQKVFRKSGVEHAVAHRFRHTLAIKILENGGTIEDAANILGDSPTVIRKHYLPWCNAFQLRITRALNEAHKGGLGTQEVREDFSPLSPAQSTFGLVLEVGVEPT